MPETVLLSPILLYVACALGAIGVVLAMPRKNAAAYVVGAAVAAGGFAVAMVGLARGAGGVGLPGPLFYAFALIALASGLRVITHPRPIYSALYFILTIVASSGLYVLLAAEFMAFALIIVYAGAILITYMFVIMLASEGATESATEGATEYDRVSREPVIATAAGFVLLAALSTMLMGGASTLTSQNGGDGREVMLMTERTEAALRKAGVMKEGEKLAAVGEQATQLYQSGFIKVVGVDGVTRDVPRDKWAPVLTLSNTEGLGFELMERNPGAIEIAGVILLMAMLGAVILARKKVEMDEAAKAVAARRAADDDELGVDAPFVEPAVGGNQ
ncbi:MAG TPA: NADH-quinone oxidoreductase subunit J [Phycisphaerales bacterium]|nr:NADH-quinone oxidoreductase subunit J [Phycisphaerales bacterium]